MSFAVALFGLGTLAFFQLPALPGWAACVAEALALLSIGSLPRFRRWIALPAGFVWAHLVILATQPPLLPVGDGPASLLLTGRVVSMVQRTGHSTRFVFEADSVVANGDTTPGRWRIRLSWPDAPGIEAGKRLHLTARVRVAHGYAVPGAWDYEGWLYWQGIRYTGYVVDEDPAYPESSPCCPVTRIRSRIGAAMDGIPASAFARGVIRALVVGDRSGLSSEARQRFRDTGTSHLMAISGLHIGLMAGIGFTVFAWIWRRVPRLAGKIPDVVVGAPMGFAISLVYALLAGLSLPTQRALVMLGVLAAGICLRREARPQSVLATAAAAVLLWSPSSIISAGFWLSFGAVVAILAAIRLAPPHEPRWRTAVRIQLAVNIALWPILAAFGLPFAATAPLVNLVLVPLFGLLVVPLSLLGAGMLMTVPDAGTWLLTLLGHVLDVIDVGLEHVAGRSWGGTVGGQLGPCGMALGGVTISLLLAPRGFPFRGLAVPLFLVLLLPRSPALDEGDFNLHVLDVGQGLGTVVETRRHTLVFDTGPAFRSGFSAATAAVIPFLERRGRMQVDRLVLSHGDNDHAGGANHLLDALEVANIDSGEPGRVGVGAEQCVAGRSWRWDGVTFEYLHPPANYPGSGNNASCVLRIANARSVVLLTGDIEAAVERQLVRAMPGRLRSDIVVVPHHGSRTSSSAPFVGATRPKFAVYTSGWANRYGFPAAAVGRRWHELGSRRIDTAGAGTISFAIRSELGVVETRCHRVHRRRFWWHDSGSAGACHAVSSAHRRGDVTN